MNLKFFCVASFTDRAIQLVQLCLILFSVQSAHAEAPVPTVQMTRANSWVNSGETTSLHWASEAVSECIASGDWSGSKATFGFYITEPLTVDTNYTLSCSGEQGTAIAIVSVQVRSAKLSWARPTQRADGSPLEALQSYKIYYGNQTGIYTDQIELDASFTELTLQLTPGQYYFSISSIDPSNNEGQLSKEVSKQIF